MTILDTTAAAKKGRLDRVTAVRLYEKMKGVLVPAGKGLFAYKEGHSDASLAEEFDCSEKTVIVNRVKLFGKLKLAGEYIPYSQMLAKVHTLETRLERLEKELGVTNS